MTSQSRTVRVFLSSTFRDFAEERDLLVRKIFPELRRKCRERQVELVDVDLRWGITEEEAQQGKVLPICLAEIDRSRPYFMGFIGERYGWVPEKEQYDLSLIMEQSWLDEHRGGKSVTELEMLYGVLNNPAMEDRAFFYFRDSAYSQAKGGAYLSEGPQEKAKLEALKECIRQSGFPIVENYRTPDELAERVRDDLWKLIDEAFPESEVPDALTRERMRHEAYSASRLGLYIGGDSYFTKIDSAMAAEVRKPVLVTGDSGGGKSALLANWASRFSQNNPSAILLTHCLATGADAAQPVNMAVRILREISRITGEELVLEGDPRKALHMLSPWLAKAGAFAALKGGLFVLVLDGLDKMVAQHDMGWWPSMLPEGVGLVASCLSGKILDAIASRMDWEKLPVSPLQREDCETFIASHLGKYRKSLTPELTSKILAHPLSGNPLFLRTLLEELRVFGVHEELGPKLDHYLTSQTVDDLFERVLKRVESDNSPESVRAVLEVLWAAKESFAEDELLAVSGLPPAGWAPIHIALDESLIGEGGRLAFSHDYLRKAVEDRYLPSVEDRRRIQNRMAEFCAQAMAGGRKDISHYVRRHAVEHFLEVEDWDNATAALSDLEFIEARAIAQELSAMLKDYAEAVKLLPEGKKERQTEAARQAELDRYALDMAKYAATCSRIRYGSGEPEASLPRPVEPVRLWTEEEIAAERKRMTETPNRLDIVKAFRVFVATNSTSLQKYSSQEAFVANLARNDAPAGPVHEEGKRRLESFKFPKLIKQFSPVEIYNPLPACHAILEGHTASVESIALSADGRCLVSGGGDTTIRVWDMETGVCLRVLEGHKHWVNSLALSADGQKVFSGSGDATLRIWDIKTGKCLKILEGHMEAVKSIVISADSRHLVSGSLDGTLRLWDIETGECLKIFEGHMNSVESFVLSLDESRLVSGSADATVRVWDLETGECLKMLEGHTGSVVSLALSADGKRVVSGSFDQTLRVWDVEAGECLNILIGHTLAVSCLILSKDQSRLVSGSGDETLRVWDIETGECLKVLKGHANPVLFLALRGDGKSILSASFDGTLRIWDIESGRCLKFFADHTRWITSLVMSADGRRIISGSNDAALRVWDLETGEFLNVHKVHMHKVSSLILSTDAKRIISSASRTETLRVWDISTGECLKILEGHTDSVESIALSVDGRRLVSGGFNGALRVWDLETGECLNELKGHADKVVMLAVSNNGQRIVSGSFDRTLRVWDMVTGECLKVLEGHTEHVVTLVLSPEGQYVVSGSWDKTIRVWDIETGQCLKVLQGLKAEIESIILSPDERYLVFVMSGSHPLRWDIASGEINALEGHTNRINSIVLSADGRRLFSGSWDKTIRVWDLETGKCLKVLSGHTASVESIVLIADGRGILSEGKDNMLRVWDIETGKSCGIFDLRGKSAMVIHSGKMRLAVGFSDGHLEFYNIENLPLGPLITTAHREIISEDLPAGSVTARPPCCGQLISIPATIADRIEHWTLEGGEGGYTDPCLLLDCPNCRTPLRMNPFFVDVKPANT